MQDKITLELTVDEVIMLQELTEDMDAGYKWMVDIAASLRKKALQAYQKPKITEEEYRARVEKTRELWKGEPAEGFMVHSEKHRIKFYNELPSEVDIWE